MEECDHNDDVLIGYMTHKGVMRKTMRCKKCKMLLDYFPQYASDDINE